MKLIFILAMLIAVTSRADDAQDKEWAKTKAQAEDVCKKAKLGLTVLFPVHLTTKLDKEIFVSPGGAPHAWICGFSGGKMGLIYQDQILVKDLKGKVGENYCGDVYLTYIGKTPVKDNSGFSVQAETFRVIDDATMKKMMGKLLDKIVKTPPVHLKQCGPL